jgi:hypothetical protein
MKVQMLAIDRIVPYPGNPRTPKAAVSKVKASLKEFGFQQPIVVDANMVIIVGHTRHQAARELGLEKVPVVVAAELTETQAKAYLNKLRIEMSELAAESADLSVLGFDVAELEQLMGVPTEPETRRGPRDGDRRIISYSLIFDDESAQATWFDFLRFLKRSMPAEETISARLTRFLSEGGYGAHS